MTYTICTVKCEGSTLPGRDLSKHIRILDNQRNGLTPCLAYQKLLEEEDADFLIYLHDDVTIHDPDWGVKLLCPFLENENCIAVGLGGATGLGNWNLHRQPYALRNMARTGYASNQTDAEVHGERFTGERRVAVLDAFCMAVRRSYLLSVGGWPTAHLTFHCLDLWLACQAARDGKEIWMTGASCTHHGGGSSTKGVYQDAKWLQGGTAQSDHELPHLFLFNEYRDVLPIKVGK
jgi:hypothetical protein